MGLLDVRGCISNVRIKTQSSEFINRVFWNGGSWYRKGIQCYSTITVLVEKRDGLMAECYAHTGSDSEDVSTWQTLSEHANEVARRAEVFAEKFDMAVWGRTLGLLHDAGKVSVGFRKRLEGGKSVDHSTAGAKIAVDRYGICGQFMAYALCGHHGGLPNGKTWLECPRSLTGSLRRPLKDRLGGEIESYDAFFELVEAALTGSRVETSRPSATPALA